MSIADVSELDGRTVIALLVGAMRADRFSDGAFLGFCKNGSIIRWLERLKAIDESKSNQSGLGEALMVKKKFKHGIYSHEEQMRLEEKMREYLISEDKDGFPADGLRKDAPEDIKRYYEYCRWEAEELARTGIIYD